jgi:hypothetical protein
MAVSGAPQVILAGMEEAQPQVRTDSCIFTLFNFKIIFHPFGYSVLLNNSEHAETLCIKVQNKTFSV